MMSATLVNNALMLLGAGALLSAIPGLCRPLSGFIAGIAGTLACACALAGGALTLAGRPETATLLNSRYMLLLTPLNAVWLITIGLCGCFICLYHIAWQRHPDARTAGPLLLLVLAGALLAVTADNLATLAAGAELATLSAALLTGNARESKPWFALGRLGTLLIALCCLLLWQHYGTLNLAALHARAGADAPGNLALTLGLAGFGLLAGIIPLHGWVPQAHASAGAPAAALFSAVVLKTGVWGVLTLALLSPVPPLWYAVAVMVLGMVTAFIGGLYALMEHNINRLLAYHSLENIGIILLGLGAGLTGYALNAPALAALGMAGGLYHLFNHSLFKTTLFLGAGAVWFRTGQRDIEKLGGIGKRMPAISLAMLVGLMAMAALPPLNGFAGEWVIYQSFFRLGALPQFLPRLLGPLLAVGLAITGALAVMCMAKVYGVTFSGAPRTPQAERAAPAPWLMTLCVVALALCCVIGGVAAPWLLPMLSAVVNIPNAAASSVVSQPLITLLLIAAMLLAYIISLLRRGDRLPARRRGSAWVCGYDHEPTMVITAHGFAAPLKSVFGPIFALRRVLNPMSRIPLWQHQALAQLFRRLAVIELGILLAVVITRSL
ncbi:MULTISPECIES: formate hydrogenlyase subunit 3 [Tenebrionibacter/Tenebrionicola group]|jgi:formate hydrogenlyase subunit 3|uniref:Formate hydrogenlyase subunit 3 n=2 Tax=Tenebrionibacter/Tenebrionicola group TaxID=2969848 RepID=A0A8K0V972_9ENTR|nr:MULTISPECIES: formate hydrogenlyase subunit 3 [Tenebrionibacter/Tenebrionicola group]MBK4716500.1 formate hydrogenlyase subunit 3 [Tenebrionibacter intestinalis]MBV5097220.1 formate hydrogenlyase subunit 3 [Tenebrionicola larvae]